MVCIALWQSATCHKTNCNLQNNDILIGCSYWPQYTKQIGLCWFSFYVLIFLSRYLVAISQQFQKCSYDYIVHKYFKVKSEKIKLNLSIFYIVTSIYSKLYHIMWTVSVQCYELCKIWFCECFVGNFLEFIRVWS